jgi:hypothetical protein
MGEPLFSSAASTRTPHDPPQPAAGSPRLAARPATSPDSLQVLDEAIDQRDPRLAARALLARPCPRWDTLKTR